LSSSSRDWHDKRHQRPASRQTTAFADHAAHGGRPENLNQPGYRLHPLHGERKGQWAIWVSGNWRLVFEFDGADAFNVDLVDYH
jgi:toxin HigB-1